MVMKIMYIIWRLVSLKEIRTLTEPRSMLLLDSDTISAFAIMMCSPLLSLALYATFGCMVSGVTLLLSIRISSLSIIKPEVLIITLPFLLRN